MSVIVDLNLGDVVACNVQIFVRDFARNIGLWVVYVLCLIGCAFSQLYFPGNAIQLLCIFYLVWLPCFLTLMIPVVIPIQSWFFYKHNRKRLSNVLLTISPAHFTDCGKDAGISGNFDWAAIVAVELKKRYIWIQITKHPTVVVCIPLRCFPTANEAEQFYKVAYSYWQNAKPLNSTNSAKKS
ncbi:MAG: hypothetical protein K2X29_05120 [Candidatus Obscuribacterales bacterium]|nr:hypothetical protein [Candidatus Obscuribacterales bacterium]